MNQFSFLDELFPIIPNRLTGEVVSVALFLLKDGEETLCLSSKRKAWYVNASVNAYHLHRQLCRDLRMSPLGFTMSRRALTLTYSRIGDLVAGAYILNWLSDNDDQYSEFEGKWDRASTGFIFPETDAMKYLPWPNLNYDFNVDLFSSCPLQGETYSK